ncbi:MAG: SDR family oxidoreductase [Deltaproteobacteria bacterium]|nr:SDR family oxidoreductase [Deltaproteobacteria bacterium]
MSGIFEGQVALISGGTRGMGLASAKKFAQEGAAVVVCGSNQKNVDQAVEELKAIGPEVMGVKCDVSRPGDIEAMFDQLERRFNRLDTCMVTAGVCPWTMIEEITLDEFENTFDINVKGMFLVSQKAGQMIKKQGKGSIIQVGSIAGFCADPEGGLTTYCATKGAVHLLTKSFSREFAPLGIRVNGIAPGWIATDMNQEVRDDPELMATYTSIIPLGRFGQPEEVAELAAFLASDEASFVNGCVVVIDGGNMAI